MKRVREGERKRVKCVTNAVAIANVFQKKLSLHRIQALSSRTCVVLAFMHIYYTIANGSMSIIQQHMHCISIWFIACVSKGRTLKGRQQQQKNSNEKSTAEML